MNIQPASGGYFATQMTAIFTSIASFISSTILASPFYFFSYSRKTLSNVPDDVLLEIFACLDFSTIIALRLTCRKCYHVSRTAALWRNLHRRLTENSGDWREALTKSRSTLSANELERVVTRMVQFERNWHKGEKGVQQTLAFKSSGSWPLALLPGGRWYLEWTEEGIGGFVYYDLDAPDIRAQMLIPMDDPLHCTKGENIVSNDGTSSSEFYMSMEIGTRAQLSHASKSTQAHQLAVWEVTVNEDNQLTAKAVYSTSVFRHTNKYGSTSIAGDSLLRLSLTSSDGPVFTIHRWRGDDKDHVPPFILRPQRREAPHNGLKLIPDGRIISVSRSWVEIYPQPDITWEESHIIPKNIPHCSPQWVYEFTAPLYFEPVVSDLIHRSQRCDVIFSIHISKTLLDICIPMQGSCEPQVTSNPFPSVDPSAKISLGSSRAVVEDQEANELALTTFTFRPVTRRLFEFAGAGSTVLEPVDSTTQVQCRFLLPRTPTTDTWRIDEQSGRVLSLFGKAGRPYECKIFCFLD